MSRVRQQPGKNIRRTPRAAQQCPMQTVARGRQGLRLIQVCQELPKALAGFLTFRILRARQGYNLPG